MPKHESAVEAPLAAQPRDHRGEGHGLARLAGQALTRRLAHEAEQRDHEEAGETHGDEGGLPRLHVREQRDVREIDAAEELVEVAAHHVGGAGAQRDAHREHRGGPAQALGREIVAHQRVRRRRQRGLAHAHADAHQEQAAEAARKAAQRGHHAPEAHAHDDDPAPAEAVGEPADGHAEHDVEQREGPAVQQAELEVGDREFLADRSDQDRQHVAIDEGQDVGGQQHAEHVVGVP